ncbi:MAG: tyrosine-type recombinase/integrase [Methylococcaceae bacterium]|nr:tyrosine-type recombinase/integrase [Methylococcaceae bacterium]
MNRKDTFEVVFSQYINDRALATDTIKHMKYVINLYQKENCVFLFSETTKEILNNWKMILLKRASAETCNNYLRHLKALYSFAFDEEIIDQNPFARFRMVKVLETKYKSITIEDINKIITYLKKSENPLSPGWFWIITIKTLFYTGMRRRQLVELKWKDINFDKQLISLNAESSKNKRYWDIPLHSNIYNDLLILRQKHESIVEPRFITDLDDLQVFNVTLFNHKYHGNKLKRSQLSGFFRNLSDRTKVKCSSHRFRHRIATDLVKSHSSIKDIIEVQELLGHADIKTTLTYIEKNVDKLRNSLEELTPIDA